MKRSVPSSDAAERAVSRRSVFVFSASHVFGAFIEPPS